MSVTTTSPLQLRNDCNKHCHSAEHSPRESTNDVLQRTKSMRCGWQSGKTVSWMVAFCFVFISMPNPVSAQAGSRVLPDFSKVLTPPAFVHTPQVPPVLWFETSPNGELVNEATFTCLAKGIPMPKFSWLKDNVSMNMDSERITRVPNEGSFKIRQLTDEDSGIYQCMASNELGTAVDQPISLKRAYIQPFPMQEDAVLNLSWMSSLEQVCEPPKSDPAPNVFWLLKGNNGRFHTLNSSHISSVHRQGKSYLYFAHVSRADEISDMKYTCASENKVLKNYKFGNYFRLNVTGGPRGNNNNLADRAAKKQFVSENVVVTRGNSFQIHCILSGYPVPVPTWEKLDGELDPVRTSYLNFGKTLQVDDVLEGDQGRYVCRFEATPDLSQEIEVKVEAAPYFESRPVSRNSSEEESKRFVCGAVGEPTPEISFYKNGKLILPDEDRINVSVNALEIRRIRNGATEVGGDSAAYQCKAENKHGFVWANFYLNVFAHFPLIIEAPGSMETRFNNSVSISCRVFSSPDPVMMWYLNGSLITDGLAYEYRTVDSEPDLYQLSIKSVQYDMAGTYKCVASNKFGIDRAEGTLIVI